jgi:hypothetical protein
METGRHAERRSVAAAEMTYRKDGTIVELPYFQDCVLTQVGSFDPYRKVEAETMAWGYGLKTEPRNPWGEERWNQVVTNVDNGEYILVKGVDFGSGAKRFIVNAMSHLYGGVIEVRVDSPEGNQLCSVEIGNTKDAYETFDAQIKSKVQGKHDLYLVFKSKQNPVNQTRNLFNLDWWQFEK